MAYQDARDSQGRLLFRYDPDADVVEISRRIHGRRETVIVPLGVYRSKAVALPPTGTTTLTSRCRAEVLPV